MKTESLALPGDTGSAFSSHASISGARHPDPQDRGLLTNATHALSWLIGLPGVTLIIAVEHRWVTLSGQVDWDYQRCAAVRAMQQLRDVAGVDDHITLKPCTAFATAAQQAQSQGSP